MADQEIPLNLPQQRRGVGAVSAPARVGPPAEATFRPEVNRHA
jgi:hypothetical protein